MLGRVSDGFWEWPRTGGNGPSKGKQARPRPILSRQVLHRVNPRVNPHTPRSVSGEIAMLERLFKLGENKTTVRTEIVAGLTTFLTMAYIIFVNPQILAAAKMPIPAGFVSTCPAAALRSFLLP